MFHFPIDIIQLKYEFDHRTHIYWNHTYIDGPFELGLLILLTHQLSIILKF